MSVNELGKSLSGLQANAYRMGVSANNTANVNTNEFQASQVRTTDAAYINDIGQGTRVAATYTDTRPGPVTVNAQGGVTEMSNTNPAVERTNQIAASQAYGVNAGAMRIVDQMNRTMIDLKG